MSLDDYDRARAEAQAEATELLTRAQAEARDIADKLGASAELPADVHFDYELTDVHPRAED
jgi:F0F1-type ATP synthase membrane subunit b/b'